MARVAAPWPLDLSDALALLNVDVLRHLVDRLETPKPRPTRKADMVRVIGGRLTGDSLRRLWDRLGEIQKSAVSEVLHGPEHKFSPEQFEAKYGALPADLGSEAPRGTVPLRLFLYPEDRYTSRLRIIPGDLAEHLLAFVPPPAEATLAVRDELPETVEQRRRDYYLAEGEKPTFDRVELVRRDMEHSALRDLPTVMRLVAHGRVAVSATTRQPSAAGMLRIAEVLDGGDFYDPGMKKDKPWEQVIGPIRGFAWPMLLQAAKLAEPRGSKLALTKAGHAVLAKPPEETLRRLWERWLPNTLLDEFSRVDDIKGQQRGKGRRAMTSTANRRPALAEALRRCPVGRWVNFDEFSRFMRASSFTFDVTRDPWRLYLVDARYGSLGYAGYHDWSIVQGRYLLCLVFEYAATLGLVDVAYVDPVGARSDFWSMWGAEEMVYLSRYDGLQYFRLTPLGAWCLGLAETWESSLPAARTSLTVFPDRRLHVSASPSSDERLMLETWASLESDGAWRLDRDRTLAAVEGGHAVDDLREFLAARDEQPLPETVEGFLRDIEHRARALKSRGTAMLFECADEEVAGRLAADDRTAKLCLRAGERTLVVRTKFEDAFRKAVRALSYGISQT